MCGICGAIEYGLSSENWTCRLRGMARTIAHRGPDDEGVWFDVEAGVGLASRRLAVIDLSEDGHQPMASASGRYVVAFNGEIYNFRELRRELDGSPAGRQTAFRGHSDTEILLAAVERWGLDGALDRFVGMFAFALWDRASRTLHLVRDRLGEKPLYYGRVGPGFLFGSELKALRAYPGFEPTIDRHALALFMRYNCIPDPLSIYAGIQKLPPGSVLSLPLPSSGADFIPTLRRYWSARDAAARGVATPFPGTETEAIDELDRLLRHAVRSQMAADVPLGAFLSGGVDSSTVVALMQAQSDRPIKSFTIGSPERQYDEADYARAVAAHLGTDHTEWYVTADDAMAVIPQLPTLWDEPFADASQIPTYLVAHLARRQVTVSLSGDGGDELFGGYNRHVWGMAIWNKAGRLPRGLRRTMASGLGILSPRQWDRAFEIMSPLIPPRYRQRVPGDHLQKLARVLVEDDPVGMYGALVSHWEDASSLVLDAREPNPSGNGTEPSWPMFGDPTQSMMYLDLVGYLPNDILVKLDRASMGVSLESRAPLLDHRVVEFAWRLPLSMKIRDGQGKWALRQVLYRYVPQTLIERPKTGFGIPIGRWLRGPLREWAEELLDERRLCTEGFFDSAPIRRKWDEHLTQKRNWEHHLWDVLMFQAWLESQRGERT